MSGARSGVAATVAILVLSGCQWFSPHRAELSRAIVRAEREVRRLEPIWARSEMIGDEARRVRAAIHAEAAARGIDPALPVLEVLKSDARKFPAHSTRAPIGGTDAEKAMSTEELERALAALDHDIQVGLKAEADIIPRAERELLALESRLAQVQSLPARSDAARP